MANYELHFSFALICVYSRAKFLFCSSAILRRNCDSFGNLFYDEEYGDRIREKESKTNFFDSLGNNHPYRNITG
jgi:hypothetical protein